MQGTRLLALAALAVTAVLAVRAAHAATGPAQIRITDVQEAYRLVKPPGGGRVGATEVIRQRLYNPSLSSKQIGRADIVCTYTDRSRRTCVGTYVLPKGSIVVSGGLQTRLLYELPIVGGTGLYDNARGSLTVTSTKLNPRREVLLFRLVG